jgi:phosphorylase/glycogen(starch) synthase
MEKFGLDSITGGWDYVEPLLFGYAAGKLLKVFMNTKYFHSKNL